MSEIGGIKDRLTLVTAGAYFDDIRKSYDLNDNLIFKGVALDHNSLTSDDNWYIWKYTYDAANNRVREEGPLKGAWDSRYTLEWSGEPVNVGKPNINTDLTTNNLLEQVLIQLKITNLHLSLLTDNEISDEEIT